MRIPEFSQHGRFFGQSPADMLAQILYTNNRLRPSPRLGNIVAEDNRC